MSFDVSRFFVAFDQQLANLGETIDQRVVDELLVKTQMCFSACSPSVPQPDIVKLVGRKQSRTLLARLETAASKPKRRRKLPGKMLLIPKACPSLCVASNSDSRYDFAVVSCPIRPLDRPKSSPLPTQLLLHAGVLTVVADLGSPTIVLEESFSEGRCSIPWQ